MIECPHCAARYAFTPALLGDQLVEVRCPRCAKAFALDCHGVRRPRAGVLRGRRRPRPAPPRRLALIPARPEAGEGTLVEVMAAPQSTPPSRPTRDLVRMPVRASKAPPAGVTALPGAHARRRWSAVEPESGPLPAAAPAETPRARRILPLVAALIVVLCVGVAWVWPDAQRSATWMTMASQPPPTPQIASLVEPIAAPVDPTPLAELAAPVPPCVGAGEVIRQGPGAVAFGLVVNEGARVLPGARVEAVLSVDGRPTRRRVDRFDLAHAARMMSDPTHPHFRHGHVGAVDALPAASEAPITVIFPSVPAGALAVRMRLLPSE